MSRSSAICVDANLVVRVLAFTNDLVVAALWQRWRAEARSYVAPTLLRYEVANALHRMARAGEITAVTASATLADAMQLPINLYGDADLHARAFELAQQFELPAAYDAHYLALAERFDIEFWTTDRRLANAVRPTLPWVQLVQVQI